jgi:hypothetical protein
MYALSATANDESYKYLLKSITALQHDTQHLKTQFTAVNNATISNEQIVFQLRDLQREINNLSVQLNKLSASENNISNNEKDLSELESRLDKLSLQFSNLLNKVELKLSSVPLINDKYKAETINEATEATFSKMMTLFGIFAAGISTLIGIVGWGISQFLQSNLTKEVQVYKDESEQVQHNVEDGVIANRAFAALGPHSTISDRIELVAEVRKRLVEEPSNRLFTILIGRMLRKDESYSNATEELDKFIKYKDNEKEFDTDYADVLYNRACYKTKASESDVRNGDNKARLKSAFEDIKKSTSIDPKNFIDAQDDVDLKLLRDQTYYIEWANTLIKKTSH